ncbi:hypothetical protein ABZ721_35725 [Streptomyces sp. NPDC006733]|uniref:hypothetical protein n=1 Tax=Streptomyces sp. NPDC006733 TaxID=3155460 RepID=UPI0033C12668
MTATILLLAGCGAGTHSPAAQGARLTKAAGVSSITVICVKGLWDDTRPIGTKVSTPPAPGERGQRGLVQITLTGPQLVAYLKELDANAHPGWASGGRDNKAESTRVYDALSQAVDKITAVRTSSDPAPEVIIDDTIPTTAP